MGGSIEAQNPELTGVMEVKAMNMKAMPSMPKMSSVSHPCICGCGLATKREWHSGHDGRATGWAIRVEKGVIGIEDVPANERNGAIVMLKRRGTEVTAKVTAPRVTNKAKGSKASKVTAAMAAYAKGITIPGTRTGTEG